MGKETAQARPQSRQRNPCVGVAKSEDRQGVGRRRRLFWRAGPGTDKIGRTSPSLRIAFVLRGPTPPDSASRSVRSMAFLNRLKWVSAGLAIAGAVTTATVWGDPSRTGPAAPTAPAHKLFADEVTGRFTAKPAVAYQSRDGDVYFAVQVK